MFIDVMLSAFICYKGGGRDRMVARCTAISTFVIST
jgi:hypothetical protein